jgi:glycosyltransferase involved in cell wall biosynthesis
MKPRLSVVVCSYNQRLFIRDTLESLFNQQNVAPRELEVIVIDGGSTDGSAEIVAEYAKELAYFVSEPDQGQTHALNKGFAKATGDILGWLCSDDLLEPNAVRSVVDYFAENPQVDFVYGDCKVIDQKGEFLTIKKEIPFSWFIWAYGDHNYIPQSSAFWRRSLHQQVNGLDETFDLGMDADLFARFSERTQPRHVNLVLSTVRTYAEAKSQRMREKSVNDHRRVCLRYGVDHNSLGTRVLKVVAKTCRLSWKTAKGCYW